MMDTFDKELSEEPYLSEEEGLKIEQSKFRQIILELLKEFHLELTSLEEIDAKRGYWIANCTDVLKDEVFVLICAKKHTEKVSKSEIEKFHEEMEEKNAIYGIFITPTYFTKEALEFARNLHLKLVSRLELTKLLGEQKDKPESEEVEVRETFILEKNYSEVREIFEKRKKKILGFFAASEKIEKIEKRAIPLGLFTIKQMKSGHEFHRNIYVDLNSGEIYKIDGRKITKDAALKKILELPETTQECLFELIEHKSFEYGELPKKDLKILEKKDFVKIKSTEKDNFLVSLMDELLSFIQIFTDAAGELLKMKRTLPPKSSSTSGGKRYVTVNFSHYKFRHSHDLGAYIEKKSEYEINFNPDAIIYEPKKIQKTLEKISGKNVKFKNIVYLPYYELKYRHGKVEHPLTYCPLKFKSFSLRERSYGEIYNFVDKAPEIPFLFLALLYAAYTYPDVEKILYIFHSSFIFVLLALVIGVILKSIFKTEREISYISTPIVRYGFPSLHSLTSLGAIAFVYFIPEVGFLLSLALLPLGFLYIYSRLKLGVHSMADVIGGAIIGSIIGLLSGYFLLQIQILNLSFNLKLLFTLLFFILPIFSILYRIKSIYL